MTSPISMSLEFEVNSIMLQSAMELLKERSTASIPLTELITYFRELPSCGNEDISASINDCASPFSCPSPPSFIFQSPSPLKFHDDGPKEIEKDLQETNDLPGTKDNHRISPASYMIFSPQFILSQSEDQIPKPCEVPVQEFSNLNIKIKFEGHIEDEDSKGNEFIEKEKKSANIGVTWPQPEDDHYSFAIPTFAFGSDKTNPLNGSGRTLRRGAKPRQGRTPSKSTTTGTSVFSNISNNNNDNTNSDNKGGWYWGLSNNNENSSLLGNQIHISQNERTLPFDKDGKENSSTDSVPRDLEFTLREINPARIIPCGQDISTIDFQSFINSQPARNDHSPLACMDTSSDMSQSQTPLHASMSMAPCTPIMSHDFNILEFSTPHCEVSPASKLFSVGKSVSKSLGKISGKQSVGSKTGASTRKKKLKSELQALSCSEEEINIPERATTPFKNNTPTDDIKSDSKFDDKNFLPKAYIQQNVVFPPQPPSFESLQQDMSIQQSEMYRKQGSELYAKEDYPRALEAFNKALDVAPQSWLERGALLSNRAATLMMIDRYMDAVKDCDEAIKINPLLTKLYARKGRALLKIGEVTSADEAFSRILEITSSTEVEIEKRKAEARESLKCIANIRALLKRLSWHRSQMDYEKVLNSANEIIQTCPYFRSIHINKAESLCKLRRWDEAKSYIESITCSAPQSIQLLYVHPKGTLPPPLPQSLIWKESNSKPNMVQIDTASIVQVILCMGGDLASVYVECIKNIDASRNCCADVMDRLHSVLVSVSAQVNSEPLQDTTCTSAKWSWIDREAQRLKSLIDTKNYADRMFHLKRFEEAQSSYSEAIKKDLSAIRWGAVLYSNRAATYISMGKWSEAVADCNQALARDGEYFRGYLRRARAYRFLEQYGDSLLDYRRYLSSTPIPIDIKEITKEMETMMEEKKDKTKAQQVKKDREQPHRAQQSFKQEQNQHHSKPTNESRYQARGGRGFQKESEEDDGFSHFKSFPRKNNHSGKYNGGGSRSHQKQPVGEDSDSDEANPYLVLGIAVDASERDIKTAYRKLALKFHPDKNKDAGAEDKFKTITSAYATLSDKGSRQKYDLSRPVPVPGEGFRRR